MTTLWCPHCRQDCEVLADPVGAMAGVLRQFPYLIRGLSPDVLRTAPSPQIWSMAAALGHLADTEIVWSFRIRAMLGQNNPTLSSYDQDSWAVSLGYEQRRASATTALFRALRQANIDLLSCMPKSTWERPGTHPEVGTITVGSLMQHICHHDRVHIEQIRAARLAVSRALAAAPTSGE